MDLLLKNLKAYTLRNYVMYVSGLQRWIAHSAKEMLIIPGRVEI